MSLFHRTLFDCNEGSDGAHRQNYPIVHSDLVLLPDNCIKSSNFAILFLEQKPEFVRANESAQCEINKHFVHAFAKRPIRISVTFFLFNNPYMTSNRYCIRIFARYPIYIVSEYLLLPGIKHC